jgi:hypothetical protein
MLMQAMREVIDDVKRNRNRRNLKQISKEIQFDGICRLYDDAVIFFRYLKNHKGSQEFLFQKSFFDEMCFCGKTLNTCNLCFRCLIFITLIMNAKYVLFWGLFIYSTWLCVCDQHLIKENETTSKNKVFLSFMFVYSIRQNRLDPKNRPFQHFLLNVTKDFLYLTRKSEE